ncbi:MAG: hypothetical protein Q7R63_00740 [bacterium]|nr:hypothetical protein [bacterium]
MTLKELRKAQAALRRGLPKLERKTRELSKEVEKTRRLIKACTKALRK